MTNHTKGPWNVNSLSRGLWHIWQKELGHIASITAGSADEEKEQEANAILIAAAPDLLDACKQFTKWNHDYPSIQIFSHSRIVKIVAELDEICKQTQQAIAKAEGKNE